MTLKSHISGWSLFFLAAFSPGVHLQRHGSSSQPSSDSELPSEAQISRPVLQPSEAPPSTGTYLLNDRVGKPCIRATMGAEYIVTEKKENNFIYVTNVTAHVSPQPVCQGCANKTYSGVITHKKLFTAANSQSFKCKSGKLLLMSSELKIRLVPLQMQAFSVPNRDYGPKMECWADFNKRAIPIILGAVAVGLVVIALLTFQFIKDRRRPGYDRI
ncbi:lysosome-associated membrane glycoprotein 1 isoform X2 [Stegastes partitus]|uniref:Lysosome-associated membrane glycoprotein 1 isoform X2 n=1 Tax=Stegastes partitus TaxID=144197 RepID=A0A9Y4KDU5_9TELE|nr:PREDICTED: lysosome-associated membrane glycoprotein 1-like isoform X2 [Stegastes partitus]